jgi:hypothetical protein
MQQPEGQQEKVAAVSRFLTRADLEARVSRFLARHPKVSRFVSLHVPVLCPFLPMPGAEIPTPAPSAHISRFIP